MYGEISSNVRKLVSMATEYGHEHLAKTIMAKDLFYISGKGYYPQKVLKVPYARIAMASWRGLSLYNMLPLGRVLLVP